MAYRKTGDTRRIHPYRAELRLNATERQACSEIIDACRYVWNAALDQRQMLYRQWRRTISDFDQMKELTGALAVEEFAWLRVADRSSLNSVIQNLGRAYSACFARLKRGEEPGFPKFKSRYARVAGFKFFGAVTVESRRIKLPKIGWLRLAEHDYLPVGRHAVRTAAVTRRADGRWFVSISLMEEWPEKPATKGILGVHLGIRVLATTSEGDEYQNPRPFRRAEHRLAKLDQKLKRQQEGSKRYLRQRHRETRLHQRVGDIRLDAQHKASTAIIRTHLPAKVLVEQWRIKRMSKDRRFSKGLADSALYRMRMMLEYKAALIGAEVEQREEYFPSTITCENCGTVDKRMQSGRRVYRCRECGSVLDREYNSALVVAG